MKFWELFKESYIIQGAVTLIFCSTIVALVLMNRYVPDYLINFVAIILGFYFGSKTQARINTSRRPRWPMKHLRDWGKGWELQRV